MKKVLSCACGVIAAVLVFGLSSDAWAFGSWGSYGSAGSYGSYGSAGSYGSYGSYGRVGPLRRIAYNVRARRAARASYGSYGSYGSSGSYGSYTVAYSSYGSTGSYGSYGSSGSYGSYGSTAIYSEPAVVEPTPAVGAVNDPSLRDARSAVIAVSVPSQARVFVNENATTSTGESRSYVSNGLKQGRSYRYDLRVEYEQDGEKVVSSKSIKLTAGDRVELQFGQADSRSLAGTSEMATTELKLTVPENSKVFLAGMPTRQVGAERTYATSQLAAGQTWAGYTVRVEFEQDGRAQVREETLSIEGGQTYELSFEFDAPTETLADNLAQAPR